MTGFVRCSKKSPWEPAKADSPRPLAQARGVRRFRRSTGPAHALRAPLLTHKRKTPARMPHGG